MDHKAFEDAMIDGVNRNAEDKENVRLEALRERQQVEAALKAMMHRIKKREATRQIIGTGIISLGVIAAMFYLSWAEIGPGELPEFVCAIVGLAAGARLTALARAFRK